MEVDTVSWSGESGRGTECADADRFTHMREFVAAAREFHATHTDASIGLMSRNLGLIVSTCDLSIFTPGRSEVCAFFGELWRVMSDARAPHWACVAALARASKEPSARYALTHTYKFLPVLAQLLSDSISLEKKLRLLSLMQDLSYGVKITWQEAYLPGLLKQLTDWVTCDASCSTHGRAALCVLVNLCQGNPPAMVALQRTVDTKQFVTRLINMKDDGYGGVETCRLLVCLSARLVSHRHVHSYLSCATASLVRAISERDPTQLMHIHMFLKDLCSDPSMKVHVMTYPHFANPISEIIKDALKLCDVEADNSKSELIPQCLEHVLNCLNLITKLEIFTLREIHNGLLELSMKVSRVSLGPSLNLLSTVLSLYREEGHLPHDLMQTMSGGLPSLLVPPTLEPGKAGLPWLIMVGLLCDFTDLQERLLHNLTAGAYEEILFSVIHNLQQIGLMGAEDCQQAAVTGCAACLSLAQHSREWDAALARLLAHHQVCKLLSACLSTAGPRRKLVLQIVKHPHFPPDKINQVFGCKDKPNVVAMETECGRLESGGGEEWGVSGATAGGRGRALDSLIENISRAVEKQQVGDIATSCIMELYGHKLACMEQQLQASMTALKAASEHTASLQHSIAMLQTTNSTQQDMLYSAQLHNERQKEQADRLAAQLEDAEKSVRGFRTKLAAERLDKDNQMTALKNAQRSHVATLESEIKSREKELCERDKTIDKLQADVKSLQTKLQQQSTKNSELATVLVKFEERVKVRDRKLEEAVNTEGMLRRDIDKLDQTVKQLEKTVLERENRLYQVTSQLEEMKRVQDMVAKLMSSGKAAGS